MEFISNTDTFYTNKNFKTDSNNQVNDLIKF